MLEFDAVARGHPKEVGGAPDDIVLELADLTVSVNELPHHLDDAQAARLVHRTHDDAGEMIEIDRLALDQHCRRDQLIRRSGIKPKAAFDQAMKLALLDFGWLAVEGNHMNQQSRCGQTVSVVVKPIMWGGRNDVGDELA